MEYEVSVDKQGRMVIPSQVRKRLGLSGGGKLLLRVINGKIELVPISKDLEKGVAKWKKMAMATRSKAFTEDHAGGDWKWVSREYAERKLGLR